MCDFTKGIKLCTCDSGAIKFRKTPRFKKVGRENIKIEDKENDTIPLIYIWRLFRHITKEKEWLELGTYNFPSKDMGKGLNAEWIALNLNIENCFDFEYIPQEGDNLFIQRNEVLGKYISFIYRDKEWKVEHYDPFVTDTEQINEGLIKNNE